MSEQQRSPGAWDQARPPQAFNAPVFNAPAVVLAIIAVLALVHGALFLLGENWQVWALYALALIPARFTMPGFPMPEGAQYWSLASYMLLHADMLHLFFNSIWLLVFGTPTARYLGTGRFLALFLAGGVAGGLASLALHWGEDTLVIGASGAVSGLLAAAIPIMYGHRVPGGAVPLSFAALLRTPRALMFTAVWLVITVVSGASGWTGNSFVEGSRIAWEAHVGGFLGGLFAFYALAPRALRRA